jgi:CMP-N-acetylneuraminic acid synthetase
MPNVIFEKFGGKPLIDYTLESTMTTGLFDKVIVSTDDPLVQKYCLDYDTRLITFLRSPELSGEKVRTTQVAYDAVLHLEDEHHFFPDIIVFLNVHSPLRDNSHIQSAVDTLVLYNTDIVISVYDDYDLHYLHGEHGLKPLMPSWHDQIRTEREALYVSNGAIRVSWRDTLGRDDTAHMKVGHIVMGKHQSFQIKDNADIELLRKILAYDQQLTKKPHHPKTEAKK